MDDLANRLLDAIGETERIARLACGREQPYTGTGEHWRWEYAGLHDDRADSPVPLDTTGAMIAEGGAVGLRSVEQYPTSSVGPLPNMAFEASEVGVGVAAHILRHDPASVLRRCAADRKIVEHWQATKTALDAAEGTILAGAGRVRLGAYDNVLLALAEGYGITEEDGRG